MKKFIVKLNIEDLGTVTKEIFALNESELLEIVNKILTNIFEKYGILTDFISYEVVLYLNDV